MAVQAVVAVKEIVLQGELEQPVKVLMVGARATPMMAAEAAVVLGRLEPTLITTLEEMAVLVLLQLLPVHL